MRSRLSWPEVRSAESTAGREQRLMTLEGGSYGCVVAGRLAALDKNLKVLLIEGGENNLNNPWVPMYAFSWRSHERRG